MLNHKKNVSKKSRWHNFPTFPKFPYILLYKNLAMGWDIFEEFIFHNGDHPLFWPKKAIGHFDKNREFSIMPPPLLYSTSHIVNDFPKNQVHSVFLFLILSNGSKQKAILFSIVLPFSALCSYKSVLIQIKRGYTLFYIRISKIWVRLTKSEWFLTKSEFEPQIIFN